jgi:hypothetical protein
MLGRMGEHSDSENVRVDDRLEDEKKEPVVAAEPEERVVEREPEARPRSSAGKWLGLAALLLALVALAIAVINVVRPDWTAKFDKTPVTTAAPAPTGPSQQEVADAKKQTCDAFNTVATAVSVRSNAPLGPDPLGAQAEAVSANARLAFSVGHDYVLEQLNPATPQPIVDGVHKFADLLQVVSINSLAGIDQNDPAQTARLQEVVDTGNQLTELCK